MFYSKHYMGTIKNITFDYIFINCFISLTRMQNFINFHSIVFDIFTFFVVKNMKKCERTLRLKSAIILSLLMNSTQIVDSLYNISNILLNQFKIYKHSIYFKKSFNDHITPRKKCVFDISLDSS